MSKETRGNVKPWEAVVKAGVATVLAAGMTPAVALAQDADNADSNRGGVQTLSASDGYYSTDEWGNTNLSSDLATAISQGFTKVRVLSNDTEGGTLSIPVSLTELSGWQAKSFFDEEGPKVRDVGYSSALSVVFPSNIDITVNSIKFAKASSSSAKGATVTVNAGANVHFTNCTFSNTPVVNGTAIFENCTFVTGKIECNGSATYTGTTQEPENVGTPTADAYEQLAFSFASGKTFDAVVVGDEVARELPFELKGTKAADAKVSASVVDAQGETVDGLSASVADGKVTLSGTAPAAGTYSIKLTAQATKDDSSLDTATETLSFEVQQRIQVRLSGDLQCFVADGTSVQSADYDGIALASAGGGSSSSSQSNKLKIEVKEGDGDWQSWNDFAVNDSTRQDSISYSISPEGSGMSVTTAYDTAYVTGTPQKPGTYKITATVVSGARTQVSNEVEMRIYDNSKNLQERIDDLTGAPSSWDMEPYTIEETGNAIIPTWMHDIYGSHESGVYGSIGKGENGNFASETLTIPAGADVTLHNMKINSSVKIVVEAGGKLTLDDSVAYGTVEVNGGVLSAKNSSSFVSQIILNDGSTLEDADIVSHANYLTDGNYKVEAPEAPVIANGNVTIKGTCSIKGEGIVSSKDAQTALIVSDGATVTIPEGSSLTAIGGNVDMSGGDGGAGVRLDGGSIVGAGTLTATGGNVGMGGGNGGAGIAGTGKVAVASVKATGGDVPKEGEASLGKNDKGGDAIASGVSVSVKSQVEAVGGVGATPGSSEISSTYDPDAPVNGGGTGGSESGGSGNGSTVTPSKPSVEVSFNDVEPGAWYEAAVKKVAKRGLMVGYSGTDCFGVGESMTRAELATVLWRYADPKAAAAYVASDTDNATELSDVVSKRWYTGAVNWAVANKVMQGYADVEGVRTSFGPNDRATVEQFLTVIANLKGATASDTSALGSFTDGDAVSPWAAGTVAWAVDAGLIGGYENADGTRTLAAGEKVTRERAATIIANAIERGVL